MEPRSYARLMVALRSYVS